MLNKKIFKQQDYGHIEFKLNDIMKERKISISELSAKTNISFKTIKRLKEEKDLTSVNLSVIVKICNTLNCDISDLMKYQKTE